MECIGSDGLERLRKTELVVGQCLGVARSVGHVRNFHFSALYSVGPT